MFGSGNNINPTASTSNASTSRPRKKSTSTKPQQSKHHQQQQQLQQQQQQQPMIITHEGKNQNPGINGHGGGIKIRKDDLKLLQQSENVDCEQNDLGVVEIPNNHNQQQKFKSQAHHQKTKSEGCTPIGNSFVKSHFHVKPQMQQIPLNMINPSQPQQQNPVLDYQKFLEEEKRKFKKPVVHEHPIVYLNQKSKSQMGYYSQGHTPHNNTGRLTNQSQKSPELGIKLKNPHQNSQKQHNQAPTQNNIQHQSMISQSALSSYSNIQNPLIQNSKRTGMHQAQRSSSSKKTTTINNKVNLNNYNSVGGDSNMPNYASLNYNSCNPQSIQSLFTQKNTSQYNQKAQTSLLNKNEDQYSIDAFSKDVLNESSHFLYEEQMNQSNAHLQMISKNKSILNNLASNDESYFDATLYDQFIQGPHNISQYSTSNNKHLNQEEMSSYHFVPRPLSQNTSLVINKAQTKLIRQSPSQKNSTRTTASQMNSSQTRKITQRTNTNNNSNTMQQSLNNSGQKNAVDRRLMMGRTPSPNFLKRIAGIINVGPDFLQQHLCKNASGASTKKNIILNQNSKRSQSKQQFSSNPQNKPSSNFMIGSNAMVHLDKSLKQKTLKANMTLANTFQQNQARYKSGSVTTGYNTAQNSPKRGNTPIQRQVNNKSKISAKQQQDFLHQQAHQQQQFQSLQDSIKRGMTPQIGANPQQKLKIINEMEEKKALALVQGIKDYQTMPKQQIQNQNMYQNPQSQIYVQQQQFYQPVKMIGEMMDEDPQPLSSHEFLNMEEEKTIQSDKFHQKNQVAIVRKKQQSKAKSSGHTPHNQILDGGTGAHGIGNNLLMSKGSSENTQHYLTSYNQQTYFSQQQPPHHLFQSDQNHVQLYLEQLQNLRQSQQRLSLQNHQQYQQISNTQSQSLINLMNQVGQNQIIDERSSKQSTIQLRQSQSNVNERMPINQNENIGVRSQDTNSNKNYQSNRSSGKVNSNHQRGKTETNFERLMQEAGELSPGMLNNQRPQSSLNFNSNQQSSSKGTKKIARKKTQSVETPMIAPPSVEMYKETIGDIDDKLKEQSNFQKKQNQIIFNYEQTPFEKELEQKTYEIKKKKQQDKGLTQEQLKLQKFKEESISILKQLQESGNITESLINADIKPQLPKKSTLELKSKSSKQSSQQIPEVILTPMTQGKLKQEIDTNPSESIEHPNKPQAINNQVARQSLQKTKASQQNIAQYEQARQSSQYLQKKKEEQSQLDNQGKSVKQSQNHLSQMQQRRKSQGDKIIEAGGDENIDEQVIMITQEEERQIKEALSDINEKAFYGKILKKQKEIVCDDDLKQFSARTREITTVMRMIQKSFDQNNEPPITTTDFYRIGKMLGRGAFGKVNLAMHKLVRKLVAIKSLNKECLTDEAQKQKLMKEVSLLLKLRHNHVVKIYETIETEKHIIIVMELCAGGDLLNYVRKRRRLKEPYAKVIFKQIIDGLCYIHSKYIAHRDIKLDNILLDGKGNVKIADFGVSKQCQKGQKMTEQCGTPAYIAPEILKDRGYTFSVDLWSAGVVLFAMLYGTVPFKANNMEELHKLIVKGKYTLKDDISIEARNLLRGLLEVNPEKRLTIKQIYRHKWFADIDPTLQLFNDQEREMIRKEYTYNDPRRYNRNENEEPIDCFTEHNLESVYNSLKNATSKSIILAPFNSTQSELDQQMRQSIQNLLQDKMMVIKFARRCREIDRQYEFNNNGDLDNGVYHKFINNTEENDQDSSDEQRNHEEDKDLLNIPMLVSTKQFKKQGLVGGRASVENSFEDDSDLKKVQERQALAKKIKEVSLIQKEIINRNDKRKNIFDEIDDEMVKTYETFQSRYSGNKVDDEKIQKLVSYGYPQSYVIKSLEDNEPNYCTAGYYLMGMDQNYC